MCGPTPGVNFVPPLGKGDLLNAWTGTFHCLSVRKLNTDTFCSPCAPKITSVVPVYVMLENCVCVCVCVYSIIGQMGLTEAFVSSGYIYRTKQCDDEVHSENASISNTHMVYKSVE